MGEYLFIPKNFFFLYLLAHWLFCIFKKLFSFFLQLFYLLKEWGIRNIKK